MANSDLSSLPGKLEAHLSLSEDAGFKAFMDNIEPLPDEALHATIVNAMQKRHADLPCKELAECLCIPVDAEQARRILFYPSSEDMCLYAKLLRTPLSKEQGAVQEKCLTHALTSLYLVHGRCWERVKPFIEAGGLIPLKELLGHSNLYIASQAMQCFQIFTDEEMHPWHEPPCSPDGKTVVVEDALVWQRMFEATQSGLIPALLRHQDTFPGSGLLALTIFAWVVSWVRYNFTKDRVLHLSPQLLSLLREWSTRQTATEQERSLAKQLFEDFGRAAPALTSAPVPRLGSCPDDTTLLEANIHVVHDHTLVNGYKPSEAETLKQLGNSAYKEANYSKAISCYSKALDIPVASGDLHGEGSRRVVVLTNRAQAYLARAAAGGGAEGICDDEGLMEGIELGENAVTKHYEAAHIDAQAAVDLDPAYFKAHLRKTQALFKLGKLHEALAAGAKAPKQQHSKEMESLLDGIRKELEEPCRRAAHVQQGQVQRQGPPANKGPLISVISETPSATA